MSEGGDFPLKVRGRVIRTDDEGFVCVTDIYAASGSTKNNRPVDFQRLPQWRAMAVAIHDKLVGKSHQFKTSRFWRSKPGVGGGTYAHPALALAFAEYLSPKLALEVREVFLRYKAADATLADDILERASPEANEWAATRALGRVKRNEFTKSLQQHGVNGPGYAICTDTVYSELFGAPARKLRVSRGLPANSNLRDKMNSDELVSVMFAEMLSKQRIDSEDPRGNRACEDATRRSSRRVRMTIEDDRKDSQRRLVG